MKIGMETGLSVHGFATWETGQEDQETRIIYSPRSILSLEK